KRPARASRLEVKIVGTRRVIPNPPNTTTALRALMTGQPRRINQLETPPPKKLPRSAATKGIQKASNPCSGLNPLLTRKIANQWEKKNQPGSVVVRAAITAHV